MESEVRVDSPTPHGGVASVAYFRDNDGNPVDRAIATQIEVHELDAAGEVIYRTYGSITPQPPQKI